MMKYFGKIKKYGVISSIVFVLKMILRINLMKFHYGQDYYNVDGIDLSPFSLEKGDTKYIKSKDLDL